MRKERNLAALGKFAEAVNTGNFDLFDEAVAPECVDHYPAPGQVSGPAGYRTLISSMREGLPDIHVALETMVADEECMAFAYTVTGTHTGQLTGIAPTGSRVHFRDVQISKFNKASGLSQHNSLSDRKMPEQVCWQSGIYIRYRSPWVRG